MGERATCYGSRSTRRADVERVSVDDVQDDQDADAGAEWRVRDGARPRDWSSDPRSRCPRTGSSSIHSTGVSVQIVPFCMQPTTAPRRFRLETI
jgi:hypothetical protein